jgi:phage tail tape-measure protein
MVGESGREMFVPSSAGRIMSAPQTERILSGGGGGMTINQSFTFTGGVTERDLGRMVPVIVEESKRAVAEAVSKGGAFAQVFR